VDERIWYGIGGFLAAVALMCLAVEMTRDIIWCRLMLCKLNERKSRTRREENMVGFLICDASLELARRVAGATNLNIEEQKELFRELCEICRLAFEAYERKADRMHRRLHPEAK
jgi:hypothetical protein